VATAPKLLEANETVVLIPAIDLDGELYLIGDTLVPFEAPTSAVINKWLNNASTASLANGGNISCALVDDLALGSTDSDTNSVRTICTRGKSETPTFHNFEANMNGLMDEDLDATGVFNLFRDLTFAPDVPYITAQRIGFASDVAAAIGQDWNLFYGWTDNQVVTAKDGDFCTINETLIPKNDVNLRFTLTA
jgi:hypothetical protein